MATQNALELCAEKEVIWDTEKVGELIDIFKEHPCLYNTKDKHYHDRNERSKALKAISSHFKVSDNDISKKIKSIRTQYTRQRMKCRKTPTGTGTDEVYKPSWVHFDKLLFLDDFITSKSTISNLKDEKGSDSEDGSTSGINTSDELSMKDVCQKRIASQPSSRKKKKESKEDILLEKAIGFLEQGAINQTNILSSTKDEDEIFAQFIASELRSIEDNKLKRSIKLKIHSLLYGAEASFTPPPPPMPPSHWPAAYSGYHQTRAMSPYPFSSPSPHSTP